MLLEEKGRGPRDERIPARGEVSPSSPLSFSQQRLWFFDQVTPGSPLHNLSSILRARGALNLNAFEQSLNELVRRHESLRTTFPADEGRPLQLVAAPRPLQITVNDLGDLPETAREAEALRVAAEEGRRPFDLARGPLMRASVLRLGPEDHLLVFTTHHIVSDGWSQGVIVREMSELYRSFLTGAQVRLPELPITYADFANWQRETLRGEALEADLTYWKRALDGVAPLDLPLDRPRPAVPDFRSEEEVFELPEHLSEALRALSRQEGVTLYMTLLAAFEVLLRRYTGQTDISVGSSVANRTRREIENIVGCFVNILVLRTDLSGDPTIGELLGRVREVCLGAYAHAELPFERVVGEVQTDRNLNHNTLFQVAFILMSAPAPDLQLPGLSLSRVEINHGLTEYDLSLMLAEEGQRLVGRLTYRSELFGRDTARRMLGHWRRILEGFVADPHRRLSELELLSNAERQHLLHDLNQTATDYEREMCVHEVFERQAELAPDAVAVVHDGGQLTYGELNRRANQLARHLRSLGVGPEVRVGVCVERSPEMIVGLLAILKAGGAYVPLDPSYPLERLTFMLEDSAAPVLLTQEHLLDVLPATWASVVCLDSDWELVSRQSGEDVRGGAAPENLCYVMYTSGTTGRPKGVSVTHRGVVRLVRETNYVNQTPHDTFLQFAPISFDASTFEVWGSLLGGARLALAPASTRSPEELAETIRTHRVTILWLTAALFHQMAEHYPESLFGVRQLLAGGDVLQPSQVRKMLRGPAENLLINGYGPTENTTFTCCHVMSAGDDLEGAVPIGRPIANTQVYILDEHMRPLPIGLPGELYIGGDGLARDYLNRPGLTAEKFVPHPFADGPGERLFRSGDRARYLVDGNIEFLGRADGQVKIRGFRIELEEVESALLRHPSVGQCVVVAREERPGDKRLVAYVVSGLGQPAEPEQLRGFLKLRLPDYMLPSAFVALEALPLTPSGKVDRRALPAPETQRAQPTQNFVPPGTPAESLLADVWARVLGVERVGAHDNFFDLGGDSIRSIEVCALAKKAGVEVSVQQLFECQTIHELARVAFSPELVTPEPASVPFSLISDDDRLALPEDVEDAYPLTRLQAGMIFHSGYAGDAATYHDIFSYHLSGPCVPELMRRATAELVSRHAVLRTSFNLTRYGAAMQLVHREVELPFEVADLRHLSEAEQETMIGESMETERARRFDWEQAPLLRVQLLRRGEHTYQLTLSFHHAILDGWSLASLLTELYNRYVSLLEGADAAAAPPPETAFRDYVALELDALESAEHRSYWAGKLNDSTVIKLPRRPASMLAGRDRRVRELLVPLTAEECGALRNLARAEGVALKSVLLAAHFRVMSLLAAQPDVLTGVVSNGRPETADGERVLGLFLNTLPLRLKLSRGTWRDLIRQTFEAEGEALPFRRYPLAEMQQVHGSGQPLFETCFNFTHYHVFEGIQESGKVRVLGGASAAETNFTLLTNFNVDPASSDIRLSLDYDAAELCEEQIEAFGNYYLSALRAMADDPSARYDLHCLLPEDERVRVLYEWNQTHAPDAQTQCLHEPFEAQAARTPDAIALVCEDARLTYDELNRRANRLAHRLLGLGVGPELRVGICLDRSPEMVVAMMSSLKAGGAYLPLDPAYPSERLRFMLEDSRATVVITQRRLLHQLPPHAAHVICLDEEADESARVSEDNPAVKVWPDNLAYVIYTSGSTGAPKGVAIQHRSAVAFLSWVGKVFAPQDLVGVLFSTSICFDLSVFELFAPLNAGGTVILAENALRLPTLPAAGEVTLINLVPSALAELLRVDGIPESVRTVNLAGEPLALELVRQTYAKGHVERVFNLYGPSEDTTYSTGILLEKDGCEPPPIGRPISNTQVYLLDRQMQPVPVGTPGVLYIGGDGLARGYLNGSQLTAEKFVPHPFSTEPGRRLYNTGDLARYLPDGNLEFLGRIDQQVKVRGFRIELGEVEAVLKQHPAVESAVVLAIDGGPGEKRLVAYVVPEGSETISARELHDSLSEKLPGYMIPSTFITLERLPLTPNGKLNRAALPAPERDGVELRHASMPPRDTLELKLARVWEEVLGVRPVGVLDNFFLDLGGHSILAVRLMAQIEKQFGRSISLPAFLRGATVEQLAAALRREQEADSPTPLVPINPNGLRPPFFCVHPATGSALCYVHLARHLGPDQPFYGLQAPGLDGDQQPLSDIEEMARHYIDALRTVQPEGPYYLGGHSFGGVVAYEMAQQLGRVGQEIALLAILDTMAPSGPAPSPPELDDTMMLCEIAGVIERFLNQNLSVKYEDLKALAFEEQLSILLARLKEIGILPQDAETKHVRGLLQVEKANVTALGRYVPQSYRGKITLFRAAVLHSEDFRSLSLRGFLDPTYGWGGLTTISPEVHIVPGDHITMITEPSAAVLAERLRSPLGVLSVGGWGRPDASEARSSGVRELRP
ncbi:MAG TPA: amino acid adenylation domain-containing protein [Pyrinomonadaceae bacterium]